jgi:hypothetical protein
MTMTKIYSLEQRRSLMHAALAAVLYLGIGAAILHWSWNVIGHDLFGAPQSEFRHGLALVLALLMIAIPFRTRSLTGHQQPSGS